MKSLFTLCRSCDAALHTNVNKAERFFLKFLVTFEANPFALLFLFISSSPGLCLVCLFVYFSSLT